MSERSSPSDDTSFDRRQLLLAGGALTIGVFAFTRREGRFNSDEDRIRSVIARHVDALESGDLDAYLATIHEDSPVTEAASDHLDAAPDSIDLYIGGVDDGYDEATADVLLEYPTERLTGHYYLRDSADEWLIYDWELSAETS